MWDGSWTQTENVLEKLTGRPGMLLSDEVLPTLRFHELLRWGTSQCDMDRKLPLGIRSRLGRGGEEMEQKKSESKRFWKTWTREDNLDKMDERADGWMDG